MNRSASRKVTGTVGAAAVLVLTLGGVGYLRTASNAERIDDRNLRELARTGRTVEGTVNNLQTVLTNLAGDSLAIKAMLDSPAKLATDSLATQAVLDSVVEASSKSSLIPHLTIDRITQDSASNCPHRAGRTGARMDPAEPSLQLCYRDSDKDGAYSVHATYALPEALRSSLVSEYMEAVFLANEEGAVFLWEPDGTGVRVHELAALDTLDLRSADDGFRLGTSTIVRAPIAGRDYHFYLLSLRIRFTPMESTVGPTGDHAGPDQMTWIIGGLISASAHRKESLSLDPLVALFVGFIAILGFLAVPFVRVYTMGPRERLRVGNIFYLLLALILAAGLVGLGFAHLAHYRHLENDIYTQLNSTADSVAKNVDDEIDYALHVLEQRTRELAWLIRDETRDTVGGDSTEHSSRAAEQLFDPAKGVSESVRMRVRIDQDTLYPEFQHTIYPESYMVVWMDSAGEQVAKWTTQETNTPRISVADREYHRAIRDRRGWPRVFRSGSGSACTEDASAAHSHPLRRDPTYFVESIRSWNTGEKLTAISTRFPQETAAESGPWGVGVIVMELSSLRYAVLPAGVETAIVDAEARTLFHTRAERILEENFAEETDKRDLVRSVLHARACRELDVTYGGRRTRLVIRPLNERPLFLMTFMDRALLDTVRFEAWFVATALFVALSLLFFVFVALLDRISRRRIRWLWPDVDRPDKYVAVLAIAAPFLAVLTVHSLWPAVFPTSPASFLVPFQFLGLGLVVLSAPDDGGRGAPEGIVVQSRPDNSRRDAREAICGGGLFAISLIALPLFGQAVPWLEWAAAVVAAAVVTLWLAISRRKGKAEKNHREETSKRADDWTNGIAKLPWYSTIIRHIPPRPLYTAAMTAGLLVVSVLPGYLAYQIAFLDLGKVLVKHHQLDIANGLAARNARHESIIRGHQDQLRPRFDLAFEGLVFGTEILDTVRADTAGPTTLGRREDKSEPSAARGRSGSPMHWPLTLSRRLGDRVPFLTEASVSMRQLSEPQADRAWGIEGARLMLPMSQDSIMASTLPSPSGRRRWLLGLLGALGAIGLTVYWVSRRVLFIYVEHSDPLRLEDALPKACDEWRSTVFVGTRSISREPLRRRDGEVQIIDMMSPRTGSGDTPRLCLEPDKKAVCLDHFDYRLAESTWNRHVLAFLEEHISSESSDSARAFILITSRNPDASLFASDGQSADDKRRWDRLLGHFTKVILSDRVSPEAFEVSVELRVCEQLTEDLQAATAIMKGFAESKGPESLKVIERRIEPSELRMKWLIGQIATLNRKTTSAADERNARATSQEQERRDTEWANAMARMAENLENSVGDLNHVAEKLEEQSGGLGRRLAERGRELAKQAETAKSRIGAGGESDSAADRPKQTADRDRPGNNAEHSGPLMKLKARSAAMEVEAERKNAESVCDTLIRECGCRERLHEVGRQILTRPDWLGMEHDEIVDLIREGAETYYGARWAILTEEERLVVGQLASGALVNPGSRQAVTRLFARGFVIRGPEPRLDNESFTRFVRDTVPGHLLTEWERAGTPGTWGSVRGPLILGWIGMALFLFWAQGEMLSSMIAFLSAVGVGLGVIVRALAMFERGTGAPDSAAPS